jgi:glycosyltransferase involved in cell wall biosynthesis
LKQLKILILIPYFYPSTSFGGPVTIAYEVGKELVKRGHEVVVFTSDAKNLNERFNLKNDQIEGMDVYYFRNISMFFVKHSMLFITPELSKKMKEKLTSFDVIYSHEYSTYQNIVLHKFAKKYRVPYIIQAHGSLHKIGRIVRRTIFDILFGSSLLKDASRVIALNSMEAQQYEAVNVPKGAIAIIPNGIDFSQYSPQPKGYFTRQFGLPENEKKILFLGRLNKIKGVDVLIKSFSRISKEFDNVTLVLIGPNDGYQRELKDLAKALNVQKKVLFVGPLFGKEKMEAYNDSDIYVLPSRYETFPMGLLEAYMCGLPVIASNLDGLTELVQNGTTGILFSPEADLQLSESICGLLRDPGKALTIGRNGQKFAQENLRLESTVEKLEKLFVTIINERLSKQVISKD